MHKYKGWFYKGKGLFTILRIPNFKPNDAIGQFMSFWICRPTLLLEYMDPNIIEIIANQIGIYVKHDYKKSLEICSSLFFT